MNTEELYQPLTDVLARAGVRHGPSELHGVICGLLSTGQALADAELQGLLASHAELEGQWPAQAGEAFAALRDLAAESFTGTGLDLALLLPDDDEELGLRVAALGQWAEGFLVGFGTGTAGKKDSDFSPALQEALADLAAISNVETPDESGEEEEAMFQEVVEHTRVSALMVFTELVMGDNRKPAKDNGKDTDDRKLH